jgi:hypothetical protein
VFNFENAFCLAIRTFAYSGKSVGRPAITHTVLALRRESNVPNITVGFGRVSATSERAAPGTPAQLE